MNMWEQYVKKAEDNLGVEKVQESHEDAEWIQKAFEDEAMTALLVTAFSSVSEGEFDITKNLMCSFYTGISAYRNWLEARGVDVRKLEGR